MSMEETLKAKLIALGLAEEQVQRLETEGVVSEIDLTKLTDAEIKGSTGCGLVIAKKIVEAFTIEEVTETTLGLKGERAVYEMLPALPEDDKSCLEMLKIGGVLKGNPIDVLAAVRAYITNRAGIEKIPAILLEKVEAYAEANDEPVSMDMFSTIQHVINTRSYADVLEACGIKGKFMNDPRKKKFLAKMDRNFWTSITDFQDKLNGWWDLWTEEMRSMGVGALAFKDDKSGKGEAFKQMIELPDTRTLRSAAEVVYNSINKLTAGVGIPVARALAYDNTKTREILALEGLPQALGLATKDQMVRTISAELGTTIEADDIDFELNVTRYMLGIMSLKDVAPIKEGDYLLGLRKLGNTIEWKKLGCVGGESFGDAPFRR